MEDQIAAFVEQSRQLLAEFAVESLRLAPKADGDAAQYEFIIDFTRLIEDLLDSMSDNMIAVSPSLAPLLLECCTQMGRLAEALNLQQLDAELVERGKTLTWRLEKFIGPTVSVKKSREPQRRHLHLVYTSTP